MYKGIYIATSGAVIKYTQLDVISQNLANADTIAFKKDAVSFTDYMVSDVPSAGMPDSRVMADISTIKTDFSSGNIVKTGNPFDVAVDGEGFIALEGGLYTRRGDLRKDREGYLVTYNNKKVIGEGGSIMLPEGRIEISGSGAVSVNGAEVGTIKMVDFEKAGSLTRIGEGMFISDVSGTKSKSTLSQGHIETSNVNTIKEMVRMIETLREFEAYQKMIQSFDDASSKVINEIGRL